jgi:hypothetical protein
MGRLLMRGRRMDTTGWRWSWAESTRARGTVQMGTLPMHDGAQGYCVAHFCSSIVPRRMALDLSTWHCLGCDRLSLSTPQLVGRRTLAVDVRNSDSGRLRPRGEDTGSFVDDNILQVREIAIETYNMQLKCVGILNVFAVCHWHPSLDRRRVQSRSSGRPPRASKNEMHLGREVCRGGHSAPSSQSNWEGTRWSKLVITEGGSVTETR